MPKRKLRSEMGLFEHFPGVRHLGDEALWQAVALEAPLQLAVLLAVERPPERPPGQPPEEGGRNQRGGKGTHRARGVIIKLWNLDRIRSMITSRHVDFVSTAWFCSPQK